MISKLAFAYIAIAMLLSGFGLGLCIGYITDNTIISDHKITPKMNIDCVHKHPCDTAWVYTE